MTAAEKHLKMKKEKNKKKRKEKKNKKRIEAKNYISLLNVAKNSQPDLSKLL